jgi:hypothetical protein
MRLWEAVPDPCLIGNLGKHKKLAISSGTWGYGVGVFSFSVARVNPILHSSMVGSVLFGYLLGRLHLVSYIYILDHDSDISFYLLLDLYSFGAESLAVFKVKSARDPKPHGSVASYQPRSPDSSQSSYLVAFRSHVPWF